MPAMFESRIREPATRVLLRVAGEDHGRAAGADSAMADIRMIRDAVGAAMRSGQRTLAELVGDGREVDMCGHVSTLDDGSDPCPMPGHRAPRQAGSIATGALRRNATPSCPEKPLPAL